MKNSIEITLQEEGEDRMNYNQFKNLEATIITT